ncbi:unnamed protein product [Leptosia nina]|uniref:Uncharacterized protein n=1 Tax=Leptosia nina TaxID=320188 RepID=A0AAV1J3A0_9NEOP
MGLLEKLSEWFGGGGTPATVLVLGLDNSGKTALLQAFRQPDQRNSKPTTPTGLQNQEVFQSGGVSFNACELRGAARMRALWEREYAHAEALVWVVDAADRLRLAVARDELQLAMAHPSLCARRPPPPLLVLANKTDLQNALSPTQLAAALGLERITDKAWHICATSAITGAGVPEGIAWLARQLRDQKIQKTHNP